MAELIFVNGDVVDPSRPRAEAVAVSDGRITDVGATAAMLRTHAHRDGQAVEVIDLGGGTLLPGFVEAHGHPTLESQTVIPPAVDIRPFSLRTHQQVIDVIARTVSERPAGEPLMFYGYDLQLLEDARLPDRRMLDAVAPEHPILVVNNSGHAAYANSALLAAAGVTRTTPDPPGGSFQHDADGEPTGVGIETPALFALAAPYTAHLAEHHDINQLLAAEHRSCSAAGITTTSDMAFNRRSRAALQALATTDDATTRIVAYEMSDDGLTSDVEPGWGDDMLGQPGIKFWADGSPWVGNIDTTFAYLCTPMTEAMGLKCGHVGEANYSPDQMRTICEAYFPKGWQMAVHVHGDHIADAVLDIYSDLVASAPGRDHRLRLEHCGALTAEQYQRCGRLGITCSLFAAHVHYWGDALIDGLFGEEVAGNWVGARSALDAGVRISLHNDAPVSPKTPLLNMAVAMTRRTRSGRPIGLHQRITAAEALRAVTIDAAWQLFMDDRVGSITPGKWADLVLLDANPLEVEAGRVADIGVEATYLAGRQVFAA